MHRVPHFERIQPLNGVVGGGVAGQSPHRVGGVQQDAPLFERGDRLLGVVKPRFVLGGTSSHGQAWLRRCSSHASTASATRDKGSLCSSPAKSMPVMRSYNST